MSLKKVSKNGLIAKVPPARKVDGLIVIPVAKIKTEKRNVNPAEDKREKRDRSIPDVDLPQRNAKATNAKALIFKRKSR